MVQPKIVIITPVRNEEKYLQNTIDSMINQKLKPCEWIIVDDGSTDKTAAIIKRACGQYKWIRYIHKEDRGERSVGPGVVEVFYEGHRNIMSDNYDYICKLDGDIEFKPEYFSTLLEYFNQDSILGAASGKIYIEDEGMLKEERMSDEMVSGTINFYRRRCFAEIGGFVKGLHWDGIAYHRSRMSGWRTRSFRDEKLTIIHQRMMGSSHKNILHGRMRWGYGQWFMGTHVLYLLAICCYRFFEKPFFIGGLFIGIGYFYAMLKNKPRYSDTGFRSSLHAWQFERLGLGQRLERRMGK